MGGSEVLWCTLAKKFSQSHEVCISVYDWGELPVQIRELQDKGIKIHKRRRIAFPTLLEKVKGKINQYFFAYKELFSFINRIKPDRILISMGGFVDLEINPFRKFLLQQSLPFSLIVHANPETYKIIQEKYQEIRNVCIKASCIYFVSKRLRQIAERQIAYNFPNSAIVANPVNIKEIGILPWPNDSIPNFAVVGRLDVSIKGQALLLQILSQGKWKKRDWILNIYGEGPDKYLIEELVAFYSLQNKVVLHGYVRDVRNIWEHNHVLFMPSYYEGLSLALVEAMLSGRTSIVTDVGGNTEIITSGVDGYIAQGATFNSYDEVLDKAWTERGRWEAMGKVAFLNAKKYTEKHDYIKIFSQNLFFN